MKVELKNVFICETVVVAFNGQISLINLTSEITSTAFPAIHPKLSILVSISGEIGKYDEQVEIVKIDSEEKAIATVNGMAEIKGAGGNNFIANFINTVFPDEGKYWIKVTIGKSDVLTNNDQHAIVLKRI
jgi:hypothetical protein